MDPSPSKQNDSALTLDHGSSIKDIEADKLPTSSKESKANSGQVIITVKQMQKINKKLLKLEGTKKQNDELRGYIIALQKKIEDYKKIESSKQALEETIKHLQKMVDQSSKNEEKARKDEAKYREIYKHQKQMLTNLKIEVEELRRVSSDYFLLKQEVSRLNNQCNTLRQARDQHPIIMKKIQQLQLFNERIKKELEQKKKQLAAEKDLKQKLQTKLQSVIHLNKESMKEKNRLICEKQQLSGQLQALKQQLEDLHLDQQVRQKKIANEMKQLKTTLHQEHEKLKITEMQLEEARKNAKKTVDLDKVKFSSLHKEDLYNLLEESEMKIVSLKIAVDDAGQKLQQLNEKIKQKDRSIMALARELTKDYPNLDESQGMDYVEKDIIELGKGKKEDWCQIVQKVMIQNLRLKSSVTALGEQYNQIMRLEKQKK